MKSINLTVPLYNEELVLSENVVKILDFLKHSSLDNIYNWQIVLANNSSTDKTEAIARELSVSFPPPICRPRERGDPVEGRLQRESSGQSTGSPLKAGMTITYLFIPQKGKGLAIKTAWQKFPTDYYVFMDADLATDLEALPRLVQELENGADLVIGSRYLPDSKTERSLARLLISKIYRGLARVWLGLPFSDLPCGFKGVNHKLITSLISRIKNNEWFFDTELLFRAYRAGYKIKEIPVTWTETPNQKRKSRVGIIRVSWNYLKEMFCLKCF
ncbi:MAG: glycosyltransferase [Patescibacteria group bacterium]